MVIDIFTVFGLDSIKQHGVSKAYSTTKVSTDSTSGKPSTT
jgi:hypothetical protein